MVINAFELRSKRKLEQIFDHVLTDQSLSIPEINRETKLRQLFQNVLKKPEVIMMKPEVIMKKTKKSLDEIFGNVLSTCNLVNRNRSANEELNLNENGACSKVCPSLCCFETPCRMSTKLSQHSLGIPDLLLFIC